jgi:hypothetical protein
VASYQNAIDGARKSLNDRNKVRYPDADCLVFAIDGVREVAFNRPDLFMVNDAELSCVVDAVKQSVAGLSPKGLYVIDVLDVKDGSAITKGDLETLRRFRPSWRTDTSDEAQNWFPITNDQSKRPQAEFFVYPPAPTGQKLHVQYVQDPIAGNTPALADAIPLPDNLVPAIESYIIFRCEMADDEHVVQQRAQAAYSNFATILGISEKTRKLIVQEGKPQ